MATIPGTGQNNLWFHPTSAESVIVFLHGLFSDSRSCWLDTSSQTYWPDLVRSDRRLSGIGIYLAGYHTGLESTEYDLRNCAEEVHSALKIPDDAGRVPVLEKTKIFFVCHSLGGVVCRYMLVQWHEEFREKLIGLILLASPSYGSGTADALEFLARLYKNTQGKQLKWGSEALRDLDSKFRSLIETKSIAELYGKELCEHHGVPRFRWFPWGGPRIVTPSSAGRYFGEARIAPKTNHFTIAKPDSINHPSHQSLVEFVLEHEGCPAKTKQRSTFAQSSTVQYLVRVLLCEFGMTWEPNSFKTSTAPPVVYWPVRLRQPTIIHAAQAFVAAGLQRRGARVLLWIDDLGTQDYAVDQFESRILRWFDSAEGQSTRLVRLRFTPVLGSNGGESWDAVQKWLGRTAYRLQKVLTISKLLKLSDVSAFDRGEFLKQRPRRLISPAVVWTGLRLSSAMNAGAAIITLGGADERELWRAWRECAGTTDLDVGHLYVPVLIEPTGHGKDRALHMQVTDLAWDSREDIEMALKMELKAIGDVEAAYETGRLIPWCVQQVVILQAFMQARERPLLIDGVEILASADLFGIDPERLLPGLVSALAQVCL